LAVNKKLLFIGLDGATFDVIEPLMREGRMPTLARLASEGVSGSLETVFPPITASAWTSFATGKNPGKHGIFEFILQRKGRLPRIAANATLRDGRTLWEILSEAGQRVIVTNLPCTYPPREINGVMIADFMTPRGRRDFVYPAALLDEIESRFGPYRLHLSQTYARGNVEAVLDELHDELSYKCAVNRYLMRNYEWDAFFTHLWGTDRIQHELWHLIDPTHPRFDSEESRKYADSFFAYWERVDGELERMIADAGEASIWIASDHGFGPVHKYCSFNVWLLKEGFLQLKSDALTQLKKLIFSLGMTPDRAFTVSRMRIFKPIRPARGVTSDQRAARLLSKIFLSFEDVEWSRTVAYSKGNYGQIFINLKGREPHGIVEPGSHYEKVRGEIISRLRQARDLQTGELLIGPIFIREEIYSGPHLEDAPDICFLPRDMKYVALGNTDFDSNQFIVDAFGVSGGHRMNGILMARGEGIRTGTKVEGAKIVDVAPTMLYLLGLKVPKDMDGRVLLDVFTPAFVEQNPLHVKEVPLTPPSVDETVFSPEEEAEIEQRLRDLGYLG